MVAGAGAARRLVPASSFCRRRVPYDVRVPPDDHVGAAVVAVGRHGRVGRQPRLQVVPGRLHVVVVAVEAEGALEQRVGAVVQHVDPGPAGVGPLGVAGVAHEGVALEYPVVEPVDGLDRDAAVGADVLHRGAVGDDVVVGRQREPHLARADGEGQLERRVRVYAARLRVYDGLVDAADGAERVPLRRVGRRRRHEAGGERRQRPQDVHCTPVSVAFGIVSTTPFPPRLKRVCVCVCMCVCVCVCVCEFSWRYAVDSSGDTEYRGYCLVLCLHQRGASRSGGGGGGMGTLQ